MRLKLKSIEIFKETKKIPKEWLEIPNQANITINRECNLRCKHCDLPGEFKKCKEKELEGKDWEKFIVDFSQINDGQEKVVAIAAREPLLNATVRQKTATVLQTASRLNNMFAGFVTNGHFLPDFIGEYPDIKTDYLDVSLEGDKCLNDQIRGESSFKKATTGLRLAIDKKLATRIFVAMTMTSLNTRGNSVSDFIKMANGWGVENFVFHTLVPGQYVEKGLRVKDEDFLLRIIPQFEKMSARVGGQIVVDIFPSSFDFFEKVIAEIMPNMSLFLDESGYLVGEWKNSNKLFFRFFNVPWALVIFFMVTPEGFIIKSSDWRNSKYLHQKMGHIGNILQWKENPNKAEVVRGSLEIPEECFRRKCFAFCFGQNHFCSIYKDSKRR